MRLSRILLLSVLAPPGLDAQVIYGSITGNVSDKTGAAVPTARVDAVNVQTGVPRQTLTDTHGVFLFNDLQAGTYKVTVSAPSFGIVVQDNVQLDANTVRRVDVQLDVA